MESLHNEDSCSASIFEELQIDPDKIRGDAIGDTLYSERYVIKLLMKLTEFQDEQWNDDLESDMCTLWDMAAQPAVVTFLMQHESLHLFINVIQSTTVPRLLEIMVGLLGNMCCIKEVRDELAKQEEMQETLLELLTCPDSPTLVQLVRLFQSIAWDLIKPDGHSLTSSDQHWFEKQMGNSQFPLNLSFILSSSTCAPTGIGGVIGTLGILKLKALFVSLIVLAVATVFSKIFSSCGAGGFPCGTDAIPASAHSSYNDYGYGWNSQRNAKSLSDTYNEFLAGVSESLDMVEGGFKTLGIETETCKKKFVCLADNEALENPILGLAFKIFGGSMKKYRDGSTAEQIHKDCDLLYPECPKGLPGSRRHQETGFQRIHTLLWPKQHVSS